MTYSIVARDAATGELGAAVQSRAFATGRATLWVLADVGAVATQSFSEQSYGPLGLELMRAGKPPELALAGLVRADPHEAFRQVAFLSASGAAAAHTGAACIEAAGHVLGEGFSAQGNMLASTTVPAAMAGAFTDTGGPLALRLLAALEAAQGAGGDWRGQQAGRIVVVEPGAQPWQRVSDVRVDDHPRPLEELRRLLHLERGYRRLARLGTGASAQDEVAEAARAGLAPVDVAWAALSAACAAGDRGEARRRFEQLLAFDARYAEVVRRRPALAEPLGIEAVEGAP